MEEEAGRTVKLTIADGLSLPVNAVTQTFAAIGRKGAGKTYLAQLLAEQMLDAGAQVVVLDVVGNWWGLRVSADGKSKGKDLFVLGGTRGDVPITPEAGARVARFLVEKRVSAVLDISSFRQGERKRFAADFAEEYFHLQKQDRSPVHLFVEEAQLIIPQRVGPDEARMVGAWESIVRLGRNYGIGATLITQRPQSVNKEVLSQVECLCVLQVNGSHERKALEAWVQEAGADRKLVGELPGLHQGEGFVWSPSWLRIFQKVRFGKKSTFDASATPEVGKASKAATLAAVDVDALRQDLAEVVQKAEADDPKALKRRIAELERAAKAAPVTPPAPKAPAPKVVEKPVISDAQLDRFAKMVEQLAGFSGKLAEYSALMQAQLKAALEIHRGPDGRVGRVFATTPRLYPPASGRPSAAQSPITSGEHRTSRTARKPATAPASGNLASGERKILTALAQYGEGRTKTQVAILTGYAHNGGGFNNYLSLLRAKGFIEGTGDRLRITDDGLLQLGSFDALPTGAELLAHWLRQLEKAPRLILEYLASIYPDAAPKDTIAEAVGYEANGGGFNNALSRLRSLELITGRGELRASEDLFS